MFERKLITIGIIIASLLLALPGFTEEGKQPPAPSEASQPLVLTIQSDKKVYEIGEPIRLTLEFKNTGTKNLQLYSKMKLQIDLTLQLLSSDGRDVQYEKGASQYYPPVYRWWEGPPRLDEGLHVREINNIDFKELLPQRGFSKHVTLEDFSKDLILEPGIYRISITFNFSECCSFASSSFQKLKITPWVGKIFSNTITIEVVEGSQK